MFEHCERVQNIFWSNLVETLVQIDDQNKKKLCIEFYNKIVP